MAEKKKAQSLQLAAVKPEQMSDPKIVPPKRSLFRKVMPAFIFLVLLGMAFAGGVYLNYIDLSKAAQQMQQIPIFGKYVPQPKTNFETVPVDQDAQLPLPNSQETQQQSPNQLQNPSSGESSPEGKKPSATVDLEKEIKLRQQEENKKISKMARLYANMKPEEAASIMKQLDDDAIIAVLNRMEEEQAAKIFALFDAGRAARLSQSMMRVPVKTSIDPKLL